jgi:serine protease
MFLLLPSRRSAARVESARGSRPVRSSPSHRARVAHVARRSAILLVVCVAVGVTGVYAPATRSAPTTSQALLAARAAPQARYAANEVVVGYAPAGAAGGTAVRYANIARSAQQGALDTRTRLLHLAPGVSVASAPPRLRTQRGVAWAVPDYLAHIAGEPSPPDETIPNDEGTAHTVGGWQQLQWNFVGPFGVNAPEAWANVAADGAPGGRGVIVAVLDTGVAYANRGRFRRSPDLSRYTFVKGYDFVAKDPYPYDRNGHGTFVASTIAEDTNNHYGLTGLAFAARIMPVRVLNSQGVGEASAIAEGVYFAVRHHAQVINLSLEFEPGVTAGDIPELIGALDYAHRRGVLVVAAAGNEGHAAIAFPAHAPNVVSVGATTEHGCLADYSNYGVGLTLVAPGGGADADLPGDPNCHPEAPPGRDVYQVTFTGTSFTRFGMPSGYEGTSMATPHVAATAALIIASGVLGRRPTPAQITARLRATARKLGGGGDEQLYGAGLVDAAAATAPGGPDAVATAAR